MTASEKARMNAEVSKAYNGEWSELLPDANRLNLNSAVAAIERAAFERGRESGLEVARRMVAWASSRSESITKEDIAAWGHLEIEKAKL